MVRLTPLKAGLAFGLFLAAWHAFWSILVATGFAQALIDLVFWLHFIRPVFMIEPFDPTRAALLVLFTGAVGFILGYAFALFWNALHRSARES
jgi:hypothetical protein